MNDNMAAKYCRQTATYWERTGTTGTGRPIYASPIDLKVRWEDKNEVFIGPNADQFVSKSIVLVGRDMKPTDRLRLGPVSTLPGGTAPDRVPGSYEIQAWQKIPNTKVSKYLRRAVL